MVSSPAVALGEKKMKSVSPWITHVRKYRKENSCSFRDALKAAKDTYTRRPVRVKKDRSEYKPNPWMLHIKKTMADWPNWKESCTYKELLLQCKTTYKKE